MNERINSPGWATYLRVSDEDKQTPERSFAMQRQRIEEQLLIPSELQFKREYKDTLTGMSPNRKDYQQPFPALPALHHPYQIGRQQVSHPL